MIKQIEMFLEDGTWDIWDGRDDVKSLVITETLTVGELKKYYPKFYKIYKEKK